ncbi:hypothetical protein B0H94_11816 [Salsuginibacillus halophilus]|uniref:Uncharacterized protein n=1 Tax=Salsuginibacillus halophilus TaxID=517424 RepID=A0A2P8H670_9BACI|nr:hypothetical protein [Salsuginibacillus halophilus]PSL41703.1 hypothetical protein B0H94_11816 [Salsuginibacillus halophilus]
MARITVQLEQPFDEFEIGDNVYKVYYDDESLKKYEQQLNSFHDEVTAKKNVDDMTAAEKEQLEEKRWTAVKRVLELFFGEGTFDAIYSASGKSMIQMMNVVNALTSWVQDRMQVSDKRDYYTKT